MRDNDWGLALLSQADARIRTADSFLTSFVGWGLSRTNAVRRTLDS